MPPDHKFSDDFRKQVLSTFFNTIADTLTDPLLLTKLFGEYAPQTYNIIRTGAQQFFELEARDLASDFFYTELLLDSIEHGLNITLVRPTFIDDCQYAIQTLASKMMPNSNVYSDQALVKNYAHELANQKEAIINETLKILEADGIFTEAKTKEGWLKTDGSQIFTNATNSKKLKLDIPSSMQECQSFTYYNLDNFLANAYFFMFKLLSNGGVKTNIKFNSTEIECFKQYMLHAKPAQGCEPINTEDFFNTLDQALTKNPQILNFNNDTFEFEATYRFKIGYERDEAMQNLAGSSNFIEAIRSLMTNKTNKNTLRL
jgi:hypothetical protein